MTHEDEDRPMGWPERLVAVGLAILVCIAVVLCAKTGGMR